MTAAHVFSPRGRGALCTACGGTFAVVSNRVLIPMAQIGCEMFGKHTITMTSEEYGGLIGQMEGWADAFDDAGDRERAARVRNRIDWLRARDAYFPGNGEV